MCVKVNFYPELGCVSINGQHYTKQELSEKSVKDKTEQSVLRTLEDIMQQHEQQKMLQIEIEYDDITQLVMSDMFKGDNHSQALIN